MERVSTAGVHVVAMRSFHLSQMTGTFSVTGTTRDFSATTRAAPGSHTTRRSTSPATQASAEDLMAAKHSSQAVHRWDGMCSYSP